MLLQTTPNTSQPTCYRPVFIDKENRGQMKPESLLEACCTTQTEIGIQTANFFSFPTLSIGTRFSGSYDYGVKSGNEELKERIRQKQWIGKDDLFALLKECYPSMSKPYAYRIIKGLVDEGVLFRLDSTTFSSSKRNIFTYDEPDKRLVDCITGYGDYSIWNTNIFNEWVNHLLGSVITFVEVDKEMVGLVYESIKDAGFNDVLLNPSKHEFDKYFANRLIIVRATMKSLIEKNHRISIERLIVQLYSDKLVSPLFGDVEKKNIINGAFQSHYVDINKLFHIAKRKKVFPEFYSQLIRDVERENLYHD